MSKTVQELLSDLQHEKDLIGLAVVCYFPTDDSKKMGLKFAAAGVPDASMGWWLIGAGKMLEFGGQQCLPQTEEIEAEEETPKL